MLWLIDEKNEESFNITHTNLALRDGKHQLWVEKASGKGKLIRQSTNLDEVIEVQKAIDFAIERGETALRI